MLSKPSLTSQQPYGMFSVRYFQKQMQMITTASSMLQKKSDSLQLHNSQVLSDWEEVTFRGIIYFCKREDL